MESFLVIDPISRVNGNIELPGSKSISNRVLLLAAQSCGVTRLINLPNNEDVNCMLIALNKLGISYKLSKDYSICDINGINGPICCDRLQELSLGDSGITTRLLVAALSLKERRLKIICGLQMQKRPISNLVEALKQCGAKIDYLERKNRFPLILYGGYQGGNISIDCTISSQFLTALLMMAPLAPGNSIIYIKNNKLTSRSYIDITLSLMRLFGVNIQHEDYKVFHVPGNKKYYSPGRYLIEGDASSASYFLAAAAIRGGTVKVNGIDRNSIQGDIRFADLLSDMGATINWGLGYIECTKSKKKLQSVDVDAICIPDTAMTIAVVALFASGNTMIRNIVSWKVKESNRLLSMSTELRKTGAIILNKKDQLIISPPSQIAPSCCISTYNDHRIAMCFSLLSLSGQPVTILNPECVNKTFPDFFEKFLSLKESIIKK